LEAWFDEIFRDLRPCRVMVAPEKYDSFPPQDQGHVIDSLNQTLKVMPLIGFDPTSWAQNIEAYTRTTAGLCERKKYMFATVRGSGGGKTRAFTEIRRELLRRENTLVMILRSIVTGMRRK